MAESQSRWWRDLLIIPLVIGCILGAFTFVLPKIFEKEKELSYTADLPTAYLSAEAVRDLKVEINGIETKSLYAYKVEFWNSGDFPLKELPIRYVFNAKEPDFQVFTVRHSTEPPYEFGSIREEGSEGKSKRYVYSLLNPGDRVTATFLCSDGGLMSLYAKAEGLSLKQVDPSGKSSWKFAPIMVAMSGALASALSAMVISSQMWIRIRKLRKKMSSEAMDSDEK